MAAAGLGLGGDGQQVLVADGGDEIHLHVNAVVAAPFRAKLAHDAVAGRDPMVPEATAQRRRRLRVHRGCGECRAAGDYGGTGTGAQHVAPGEPLVHTFLLP